MIVRLWRARVSKADCDAYLDYLEQTVFAIVGDIDGFLEAEILRHDEPDGVQLVIVSRWESMAAIRQYAGNTPEKAVVADQAQAMLLSFEQQVEHFESARRSSS